MLAELDLSNWINLGILIVTGLVGILAWRGAGNAAKEAREDQQKANDAASRSAAATEEATQLQARIVKLEEARQQDTLLDAQKARLRARIIGQESDKMYLTIENHGKAKADNLSVLISGNSVDEIGEITKDQPIASYTVGPGGNVRFFYLRRFSGGLQPPFDISLDWDDDSETRGHWEGTLT